MAQELKPREKRHQRTRQAIIDAAREILAEKGLNGLSLRGIARAIDYSPAGLYEYFASKEDIIYAVAQAGHLRLRNALARVDETLEPSEHLYQLGSAYLRFAAENPDYFMLMFTTLPQFKSEEEWEISDMMGQESAFPLLVQSIERGIKSGTFKPHHGFGLMEMVFATWTQMHGLAMLHLTQLRKMPIDFAQLNEVVIRNNLRGLTAAPQEKH